MMKKISDYFPITSDGLFTAFVNPCWAVDFPDTTELDAYFIFKYGDRIGYKKLDMFADSTDGTIKGDNLDKLAQMILSIYGRGWEHYYKVFKAEYDPLNNTDFTEVIKEETEAQKNENMQGTSNGSGTTTSNATSNGINSGAGNVYGFNSAAAVGDTTNSGTNSDTTNATTTTTTNGSTQDNNNITDHGVKTTEHKKSGNIGVTETVTLLTSEKDFWKWSFIDQVCKDICDCIALSIY